MKSVSKFIDDFIEHSKSEDIKEKTKRNRKQVLEKLKEHLKEEKEDIYLHNSIKVRNKIERFFETNNSRSAIPPNVHAITAFFEYLKEEEDYDSSDVENCIKEVLKLKRADYEDYDAVENVKEGLLSYDERESLLRACRNSEREPLKKEVMLRLILEAGLSRSELLTLKPEDIDDESKVNPAVITVSSEWSQTKGEEVPKYNPEKEEDDDDETRNVAVKLDTRTRINELIDQENREEKDYLLWENPNYRKPKRRLEEVFEAAEEFNRSDLSFKDLQRNVIADLVAKEVPQHKVQDYFGSKSAVTSEVVKKFSLENPSESPLAYNRRIF